MVLSKTGKEKQKSKKKFPEINQVTFEKIITKGCLVPLIQQLKTRQKAGKMTAQNLVDKIEQQLNVKVTLERSTRKWAYIVVPRHNITVLSYLAKIGMKVEKHLNDGYYVILK